MGTRIDLTGHKYNRLTVIAPVRKDKSGQTIWRCRCDCGNYTEIQGSHLRNGTIKSCGCYRREYRSKKCREATGEKALHWKGGCIRRRYYYVGRVRRNRFVAEEKLGRSLKPEEIVHHINRDTIDDRPENLTVFSDQAAHMKHHAAQRRG